MIFTAQTLQESICTSSRPALKLDLWFYWYSRDEWCTVNVHDVQVKQESAVTWLRLAEVWRCDNTVLGFVCFNECNPIFQHFFLMNSVQQAKMYCFSLPLKKRIWIRFHAATLSVVLFDEPLCENLLTPFSTVHRPHRAFLLFRFQTDPIRPSACPRWTHGAGCSKECDCVQEHSSGCDPKTGSCSCKAAHHGPQCEKGRDTSSGHQRVHRYPRPQEWNG